MSNAEIARRLTDLTLAVRGIDGKISQTAVWQGRHEERHTGVDARFEELKADIRELKEDRIAQAKERIAASRFRWGTGIGFLGVVITAIIELVKQTHG